MSDRVKIGEFTLDHFAAYGKLTSFCDIEGMEEERGQAWRRPRSLDIIVESHVASGQGLRKVNL